MRRSSAKRTLESTLFCSLAAILFFAPSLPSPAQGCSQCRESLGQTPVRTQNAYRRAITLMIVAGGSVFSAAVFTLRRFR